MPGFEEELEQMLAGALRGAKGAISARDPNLASFVLVRAILGAVQAAVVDRPALNGPALVEELTTLVVRFLAP